MQCPACGHPEMEEQNRNETLSHRGRSVTVRNLRGHFCPDCDDGVWDTESNRRLDEAQTRLIDTVRREASIEIRRIRKEVLKLTQAKLAANFGLGPLGCSAILFLLILRSPGHSCVFEIRGPNVIVPRVQPLAFSSGSERPEFVPEFVKKDSSEFENRLCAVC